MIDYVSITPLMSMTTFIIGFIATLIIGVAIAETGEHMTTARRKKIGAKRRLTPSQRAIQRYHGRNAG